MSASLSYGVDLARRLIRCPSVTPAEGGALDLLQDELAGLGFTTNRLVFGAGDEAIDNLFALRKGADGAPHIAFAGHTDVVPVGDEAAWSHAPFAGDIEDGKLYGRGAADMKGGIAAFIAAVKASDEAGLSQATLSLIITGDEEGVAQNGTVKMVEWLKEKHITPDFCIVGEPTNPGVMGETIKNGRRGSLTGKLMVTGTQGHVAYPHLANNPVPALVAMLAPVNSAKLDGGNDYFDPSTAEIVDLSIPDAAGNVIANKAFGQFNIRFNTEHSQDSLMGWLSEHFTRIADEARVSFEVEWQCNAHPFVTEPSDMISDLQDAIADITGRRAALSTSGGTSDARFLCHLCPVAEFGLVGQTMHKINEHVALDDIDSLAAIYAAFLARNAVKG